MDTKTYQITIVASGSNINAIIEAIKKIDDSIRLRSELVEIPFDQIESEIVGG
jgi:hypothetical protein